MLLKTVLTLVVTFSLTLLFNFIGQAFIKKSSESNTIELC